MKRNSFILAQDILEFPQETLDFILDPQFYKQYETKVDHQPKYSSFLNHKKTPEEQILYQQVNKLYQPIIERFMTEMNQQPYTQYNWEWWWQIYEPGASGFQIHNHRHDASKFGFSFVHFVNPIPRKNMFAWSFPEDKFELHKEIKNQIIFFPDWTYHKVMPNTTKKYRVSISGNINVTHASSGYY